MTNHGGDSEPDSTEESGEVELISAERLVFFSDAVVAIAITLLALNLPDLNGHSNPEVLKSMRHATAAYLPFLISFVVIAAHWRAHHRLYQFVGRLDSRLITIDMVWLLMIIITPYATRVLSGGHGSQGFEVRFSFYAAIQVITMVTFVVMRRHIRNGGLLRPGAPSPPADDISLLFVAAAFAVSIPIAFVPGVGEFAYLVWVGAVFIVRARRRARGY
ncbi:MAG TPA: TMEM175 family protein [Streptosporangiaceae bacterium]|nr:TMEM175 family protein [Streptosporangiaceae bacterium]